MVAYSDVRRRKGVKVEKMMIIPLLLRNRRMSEHRAKLAWALLSEKEKETAGLTGGRRPGW